MDLERLEAIAQGQAERNILPKSGNGYLSKCKVMTEILNSFATIREEALVFVDGVPVKHTGEASKIFKLKLPMTVNVSKLLFAAISVDETLPKKKRRRPNAPED
jgi:hypothetical protein